MLVEGHPGGGVALPRAVNSNNHARKGCNVLESPPFQRPRGCLKTPPVIGKSKFLQNAYFHVSFRAFYCNTVYVLYSSTLSTLSCNIFMYILLFLSKMLYDTIPNIDLHHKELGL